MTKPVLISKRLASRSAVSVPLGVAAVLGIAAPAFAQAIPGLDPVKVKTIPIHRDASKSPMPSRSDGMSRMPSAANAAASSPPVNDIPPVKVQTMRVGPTGEMTRTPPPGAGEAAQ